MRTLALVDCNNFLYGLETVSKRKYAIISDGYRMRQAPTCLATCCDHNCKQQGREVRCEFSIRAEPSATLVTDSRTTCDASFFLRA